MLMTSIQFAQQENLSEQFNQGSNDQKRLKLGQQFGHLDHF